MAFVLILSFPIVTVSDVFECCRLSQNSSEQNGPHHVFHLGFSLEWDFLSDCAEMLKRQHIYTVIALRTFQHCSLFIVHSESLPVSSFTSFFP